MTRPVAPQADRSLEVQRTVLRVALFGLLILSPLPFGSVQPWAVLALEIYAAVLGALALYILSRDPAGLTQKARRLLIPVGVLCAIGVIQFLPGPQAWTRLVAGPTAEARVIVGAVVPEVATSLAPQSLEPAATLDALLRLMAYVLIGVSAAVAIQARSHFRQAAIVIAVCGACNALYGAAEYLSGHQHILWYAKRAFSQEASGTFINRNHFAAYLAMTLPVSLGLLLERDWSRQIATSWRSQLVALSDSTRLMQVAGGLSVGLAWIGVILSYSRAGLAIAVLVTGVVALTVCTTRRLRLLMVMLILPTIWLLWQEVRPPGQRFLATRDELASVSGRLPVWEASLSMIPRFAFLGTGFGTFENAFIVYRPPEILRTWDHAHNDWLQSTVEGGVLSTTAIVLVLVIAVRRQRQTRRPPVEHSEYSIGLLAAILGICLFSAVDFCLRIPANAALLAVIIGLRANCATPPAAQVPRAV
jgi:O-antigen ligase